jgi:hypothetical protein
MSGEHKVVRIDIAQRTRIRTQLQSTCGALAATRDELVSKLNRAIAECNNAVTVFELGEDREDYERVRALLHRACDLEFEVCLDCERIAPLCEVMGIDESGNESENPNASKKANV